MIENVKPLNPVSAIRRQKQRPEQRKPSSKDREAPSELPSDQPDEQVIGEQVVDKSNIDEYV